MYFGCMNVTIFPVSFLRTKMFLGRTSVLFVKMNVINIQCASKVCYVIRCFKVQVVNQVVIQVINLVVVHLVVVHLVVVQ